MAARLKLVAGDTRAEVQLHLSQLGAALDLSAAVVHLKFRAAGTDTTLVEILGDLLPGAIEADGVTPDLSLFPIAGAGGRVKFRFPPGSLDIAAGNYTGEIVVTYGDSTLGTVFDTLKFVVRESL